MENYISLEPNEVADRIVRRIEGAVSKSLKFGVSALKELEGDHKRRIFNEGKATDGSRIGRYVSSWKKVRESKGFQTSYVDLEFTSGLRNNMQVGTEGSRAVYAFQNTRYRKVMEGQEQQKQKEISKASDQEIKTAIETYRKEFRSEFNRPLT